MLAALAKLQTVQVPDNAAAEYAAGYLWGAMNIDQEPYIAECFKENDTLNSDLAEIFDDYAKGDCDGADKIWKKAEPLFQTALKGCTKNDVAADFKKLDDYSKATLSRKDADKYIQGRYTKYKAFIDKIGKEMMQEFSQGDYRAAGMYDAQIAQYLDMAPNPYYNVFVGDERNQIAPIEFLAGWLYGVSFQQDNYRFELENCYQMSSVITDDVYDAMEAYEKNDYDTAQKKWDDADKYWPDALSSCKKEATDALTAWGDKVKDLQKMKDWDKIAAQIYNDNKKELEEDVRQEFLWWDKGAQFNSGMYAGRVDKIFLDNAPKDDFIQ